ncbi:MAG: class I SAM-dependent methyltransferase [Planctomycetes bacterium]|nr:class I SAM-dependent methyltransferase [Planctomycetota bacterium]
MIPHRGPDRIGFRPIHNGIGNRDKRVTQEFYEDEAVRLSAPAFGKLATPFAEHLAACVKRPGVRRTLELGCGVADYLPVLPDGHIDYVGVDFSRGMLGKAVEFHSDERDTSFVRGDIEGLPMPGECMDLVFSVGVLGEYAPVDEAMVEAARVLRPGGIFTFTFMNLLTLYRVWKTAAIAAIRMVFGADSDAYHRVGGRMIARYPTTPAYVRSLAERAGFRDIVLQNTGDERGHLLVTCIKG